MQNFFDFLEQIPPYETDTRSIERLNLRYQMLIAQHRDLIDGRRVLDLAAHDGRWAHAFAAAGASQVVAVEAREDLVKRYEHFPDETITSKVDMRCEDMMVALEQMVADGEQFDVIGLLGIFYHTMEHFRLLSLCRALKPRVIIVDSEFALRAGQVISLVRERTDNPLNATPQIDGQDTALIGIPSHQAMEAMADTLGFHVDWLDWSAIPEDKRDMLKDYFREKPKRRETCLLRPKLPERLTQSCDYRLVSSHFSSQ